MTVITFDTLKFVRTLEAADVPLKQAEAFSQVVSEAIERNNTHNTRELATRADLAELRSVVKADLAELRSELKADIANTKVDMFKWYISVVVAQTVALALLIVRMAG